MHALDILFGVQTRCLNRLRRFFSVLELGQSLLLLKIIVSCISLGGPASSASPEDTLEVHRLLLLHSCLFATVLSRPCFLENVLNDTILGRIAALNGTFNRREGCGLSILTKVDGGHLAYV